MGGVRNGAPNARDLVTGLRATLAEQGIDVDRVIDEFGQVRASEERAAGKRFGLRDHVRGLILSLLSNQRPWGLIAANLERIREIMLDFDPDRLGAADPDVLAASLRQIRCGNRAVLKQMRSLRGNIETLRRIEGELGSLDAFVTSEDPDRIAKKLGEAGRYKLKQVGFTLAMEYLRNVGIRAGKPDVHVRRVLSGDRLGYAAGYPSEQEAYELVRELAAEAEVNASYLDNLLWMFCAKDYGDVCRAEPRCGVCRFQPACRFSRPDQR
jgi:hypothetical protein